MSICGSKPPWEMRYVGGDNSPSDDRSRLAHSTVVIIGIKELLWPQSGRSKSVLTILKTRIG